MNKPLDSQITEMSPHCPFIEPARDRGLIENRRVVIDLTLEDELKLEEQIFAHTMAATENFRTKRREAPRSTKTLLCINVEFELSDESSFEPYVHWPHYCLKYLYTGKAIMFGKFWKGEMETSRLGIPIPPPTRNFMSIRSVIAAKDPYFFSSAAELLPELEAASDDGADVHSRFASDIGDHATPDQIISAGYYRVIRNAAEDARRAELSLPRRQ